MSRDMTNGPRNDLARDSTAPHTEVPKLNLRRLETFQRLLQYGAFLVLLVFIGLIALSWIQLRRINNEVATADEKINGKKREIVQLEIDAGKLQAENVELQKKNGALTTANNTLNEVTDSLGKQSPEQAEKVKQAFEASIETTKDLTQIPPRIYLQIGDENLRKKATEVGQQLRKKGYIVPAIENVGSERIPNVSQLRYYPSDSFAQADSKDILSTLEGLGIRLEPKGISGRVLPRPRHYEIWFGKNF